MSEFSVAAVFTLFIKFSCLLHGFVLVGLKIDT